MPMQWPPSHPHQASARPFVWKNASACAIDPGKCPPTTPILGPAGCWMLDHLFHDCPWKNTLTFKGGT
ncbi:MAG: hypothetical protein EOM63_07265, partial [Clostridia bacterium]|nr:hypothetical protein [Clostridia bacterium]